MEGTDATSQEKKRKRKWKPVTLDSAEFFQGDMTGFVSLEVLEGEDLEYEAGGKIMKQGEENVQCVTAVRKISFVTCNVLKLSHKLSPEGHSKKKFTPPVEC